MMTLSRTCSPRSVHKDVSRGVEKAGKKERESKGRERNKTERVRRESTGQHGCSRKGHTLGLRVLCILEDSIDHQPGVWVLFELVEGGLSLLLLLRGVSNG